MLIVAARHLDRRAGGCPVSPRSTRRWSAAVALADLRPDAPRRRDRAHRASTRWPWAPTSCCPCRARRWRRCSPCGPATGGRSRARLGPPPRRRSPAIVALSLPGGLWSSGAIVTAAGPALRRRRRHQALRRPAPGRAPCTCAWRSGSRCSRRCSSRGCGARAAPTASPRASAAIALPLVALQIGLGEYQYRHGLPWQIVTLHVSVSAALWAVVARGLLGRRPPARPRPTTGGGRPPSGRARSAPSRAAPSASPRGSPRRSPRRSRRSRHRSPRGPREGAPRARASAAARAARARAARRRWRPRPGGGGASLRSSLSAPGRAARARR